MAPATAPKGEVELAVEGGMTCASCAPWPPPPARASACAANDVIIDPRFSNNVTVVLGERGDAAAGHAERGG